MGPLDPFDLTGDWDDRTEGSTGFPLTRREFMGAAAAAPVAAVVRPGWALAQSENLDQSGDLALIFSWGRDPESDGARTLFVTIVTEADDPRSESAATISEANGDVAIPELEIPDRRKVSWPIRPESFGPRAQFILSVSGELGARRYRLRVTNVSYGGLETSQGQLLEIRFDFEQRTTPVGPHATPRSRFILSGQTSVWGATRTPNDRGLGRLSAEPADDVRPSNAPGVVFRDFIGVSDSAPAQPLWTQLHDSELRTAIGAMFNGLIGIETSSAHRHVVATLDNTLAWTVTPEGPWMYGFGDRVRLSSAKIFWPILQSAAKETAVEALFYAEAEIIMPEDQTITLGTTRRGFAFRGRLEASEGKAFFRIRGQDVTNSGTTGSRLAEGYVEGRWSDVILDAGGPTRRASVFPALHGSILERVSATLGSATQSAARNAGTISFQADYVQGDAAPSVAMETAIGRLIVTGIRSEDVNNDTGNETRADSEFPKRRNHPVTALFSWDRSAGTSQGDPAPRFVEAEVGMIEAGIALPGADWSRLTFETTPLRLFWTEQPLETPPLGSFIDLANRDGREFARLDLGRAHLRASRTTGLLALKFGFSDMGLAFFGSNVDFVRNNGQCEITTRPGSYGRLKPHDTRPIITIEFPPQHLFEEAKFAQIAPPLPDIKLERFLKVDRATGNIESAKEQHFKQDADSITFNPDNLAHVADVLEALACTPSALLKMRTELQNLKLTEAAACSAKQDPLRALDPRCIFAAFVQRLKTANPSTRMPMDQLIYIGPVGMDVDIRQWVRKEWKALRDAQAKDFVAKMLDEARAQYTSLNPPTPPLQRPVDEALDLVFDTIGRVESSVPTYQRFRDFYRDLMLTLVLTPGDQATRDFGNQNAIPTTADRIDIEHFPDAPDGGPRWIDAAYLASKSIPTGHAVRVATRHAEALRLYALSLMDDDPLGAPSRARLSAPSRLAFRVLCRDSLGAERAREVRERQVHDLDQPEDAEKRLPRREITFSLDALTQFRGMELSVMTRAEIVYDPGELGQISARRPRVADTSGNAMLERLGFPMGRENSVRDRLAHVAASLTPPSALETSIELPARIVLSPNQNAIVVTPNAAYDGNFDHDPYRDESFDGIDQLRARQVEPLWQAEFVTEVDGLGLNPGLRAVWSPDLRPNALLSRFADAAHGDGTTIKQSEPPGGPFAPWFLSRLQGQATGMSEADLAQLPHLAGKNGTSEDICRPGEPRPGIVERFCQFLGLKRDDRWAMEARFRAAIDARARHQMVLLSSAWGLPVVGRRDSAGNLTADASQFETSAASDLWDIMPGSATYNPRTLSVTELALSSIGGTLRHDTGFQPPIAAKYWRDNRGVFDSLGLERWTQWTNLGRDVYTEIVYKGYLYPLGIRASLVQVTERIIYMDKATGVITAPLRQRMFIRVANPEKLYPALKQPFGGRRFPVQRLNLLTAVTPDIVDPYDSEDPAIDGVGSSGRIGLKNGRGLVFWPRQFRSQPGNIRFEIDVDGVKTDLPMIFVDNTAIGDETTMQALAEYYLYQESPDRTGKEVVDPIIHLRTLILGGAERRYAEEIEAGSATYQTDHWTLGVSGLRVKPPETTGTKGETYTLFHDDYDTTPLLEGADQPPFYPFVEDARIRLTQSERLVARPLGSVRARFDARYLEHGLAPESADPTSANLAVPAANPNELVLLLRKPDQVALNMGDRGDQSGGVFRPGGRVVALSRKKGAMTQGLPQFEIGGRTVASYVALFGEQTSQNAIVERPAATGSGSISRDPIAPETGNIVDIIEELRKIYQNAFSDDAKLLGLVRLKELIAFIVKLNDPDEGLPNLGERFEFGGALSDQEDNAVELVRENVVKPLAAAVRRIRAGWDQVEANLADAQQIVQGMKIKPVTIREVFPDLDTALTDLSAALTRAEGEADDIAFAIELGTCYSSGQRFLGALQRSAANPGQQLEAAIVSRFNDVLGLFRLLDRNVDDIVIQLLIEARVLGGLTEDLRESVSDVVAAAAEQSRELIPLPRTSAVYDNDDAEAEFATCLDALLPPTRDMEVLLRHFSDWVLMPNRLVAIVTDDIDGPEMLLRNWLETDTDQTDVPAVFQNLENDKLEEVLERTATEARDFIEDGIFGKIAADMEDALDDDEIRELLLVEFAKLQPKLLDEAFGILEEVQDETSGELRLRLQTGTIAQQIRNRYVLCLLLNLAQTGCVTKLAEIDDAWLRRLLDLLSRLIPDAPGSLPDLIRPHLSHLLDPLLQLLYHFVRLLDAMKPPNIPDILSLLRQLLSQLGTPSIDACDVIDPVWGVVTTMMENAAEIADQIKTVDENWGGPTCPLPVSLHETEPAEGNTFIASLLALRIYSDKARNYYSQEIRGVRFNVSTAAANSPIGKVIAAFDRLLQEMQANLPVGDEKDEAIRKVTALKEAFTESDLNTVKYLNELSDVTSDAYCETLFAGQALNSFAATLRRAKELDLCDMFDNGQIDVALAVANLPRDYRSMIDHQERMIAALQDLAQKLAEKLATIRAEVEKLNKDDGKKIVALLPFILAGKDLVPKFKVTVSGGNTDPVNDALDDLGAEIDVEALTESAKEIIERAIDLICAAIKTSETYVTRAQTLIANVRAKLDEARGTLTDATEDPQSQIRPFFGETLRLLDEADSAAGLDNASTQVQNLLSEIQAVRTATERLCEDRELTTDQKTGSELDLISNLFKRGSEPNARNQINQIGDLQRDLARIPDDIRRHLEAGPRDAAMDLLSRALRKVIAAKVGSSPNRSFLSGANLSLPGIYEVLLNARNDGFNVFDDATKDALKRQFLILPDASRAKLNDGYTPAAFESDLTIKDDQLAGDLAWLTKIASGNGALSKEEMIFATAFVREWGTGQASPLRILENLSGLITDILSGDIFKYIDFAAIRGEVEDYLLSLVPTKLRMGYGFSIELSADVARATGGIFAPAPGTRLGIDMNVVVDLLRAVEGEDATGFSSIGTLGPFNVKLIGDFFDAITLNFSSAEFTAESGSKSDIRIVYGGHKLGKDVSFLQDLQKYLAPKDGSGVILEFNGLLPGIEAGYRLHLGDFSVGNLAITNVGLEATAILPFSDSEAIFKASLSSRLSPFTLTYAPYGGSGFFAIFANVEGIIGFEASFEFGGSAVFAFGPLNGKGRLMCGVYIKQLKLNGIEISEISMTFFAGGSAAIWIFNFGAALSVMLGQVDGNMTGSATFSFSFSMGLADYEYSIELKKEEKKGFEGQSAMLAREARYAQALGRTEVGFSDDNVFRSRITTAGTCQSQDWRTFTSYFDDSSDQETYY